ncbi:MAG: 2-oxoglutarate dehydrogenase E1 component [Bacteroidales bacterium]|nr:2-oxoglutarate dehydrogenase E1 component [Bacteroidales bacterium]MCF8343680.1 2-oxoglutarate dehydrogenase E1 component [Bacteroidales bacterium]MCF8374761.1 2-oxoglutarate dehydrogenase E1 component [Bacteroidales bacterium]MCF8399835.1 2-oxoglutarate dehydrogenase E1 component [Bacteroidales bacterium]
MDKFSFINTSDPAAIEQLFEQYKKDPESVDESWKDFFKGFEFARASWSPKRDNGLLYPSEFKVIDLINDYRRRGHLFTETNPVRTRRKYSPSLNIENYGLGKSDLQKKFKAGNEIGIGEASLQDIIDHLHETYCKSVGAEFFYIRKPEENKWLRTKMESSRNTYPFTNKDREYIIRSLSRAVLFEKFIHKKFPGQKRFSLEGAESLIPALDAILEKGAELGNEEFVIGMAHRGRLNVLANILKKPYYQIFSEFEGKEYDDEYLLGDVKYHLGYNSERETVNGKKINLTLSPNPSHLEAVDPVVEGIVRAKLDHEYQKDFNKITPILIHGDASIAGQGVVYEVLQMSGLEGYKTGGTVHLVINNQIGFTTNYLDARTSTYCTDVAKVTQSPVFHVNGDDVEAVIHTIQLALQFRAKFNKDVFIDLLCYRKYGHNEGDEPRFTQPLLYKTIAQHPNPMEIYREKLLDKKLLTENRIEELEKEINKVFEENLTKAREISKTHIESFMDSWEDIDRARDEDFGHSPDTKVNKKTLLRIAKKITDLPEEDKFFRKTVNMQKQRRKMLKEPGKLDWAMGELLAYGSLLEEKIPVRLSGQDTARGTFSHRHAVLRLEDAEKEYVPLNNISKKQARFEVFNSPLNEYGVLGFEYGYSLVSPDALTIWEAQFGDFNNGGQIIIDQFLSSAEEKWNVMNDLVLLLPHGYEGQGPEHSSARLERFLILCAENNMQVVNPTSPANFFHVLRRQLYRDFRKPLIVLTPKSLLRHPRCVSKIEEFTKGGFREVLDDTESKPEEVTKVVFCTGKIYYELIEEREKRKDYTIAIVRLEQLYPIPFEQILKIVRKYKKAVTHLWVQEEPVNMGAWTFMHTYLKEIDLKVIGRPPSGSPATGSSQFHKIRQRKLIDKAFERCECPLVGKECEMICIGNRWKSFEKEIENQEGEIKSTALSAEKQLK